MVLVNCLDVLVEEKGSQPLIGRVLLELLDLIVDKTRNPNPASPEMPMMGILMTTAYNSAVRSRSPKPFQASHIRRTLTAIAGGSEES